MEEEADIHAEEERRLAEISHRVRLIGPLELSCSTLSFDANAPLGEVDGLRGLEGAHEDNVDADHAHDTVDGVFLVVCLPKGRQLLQVSHEGLADDIMHREGRPEAQLRSEENLVEAVDSQEDARVGHREAEEEGADPD